MIFNNNDRVLVLSPHFDDTFLSVGGIVSRYASTCKFYNLVIFGFDPYNIIGIKKKKAAVRKRIEEETLNSQLSGISLKHFQFPAGYKERGYDKWHSRISSKDRAIIGEIREEIFKFIRLHKIDIVLCPRGIGGHVDHRIMSLIGLDLVRTKMVEVYFYEDLPYSIDPTFWTRIHSRLRKMYPVPIDTSHFIKHKKDLLLNYESQITPLETRLVIKYSKNRVNTLSRFLIKPATLKNVKSIEVLWSPKKTLGLQ